MAEIVNSSTDTTRRAAQLQQTQAVTDVSTTTTAEPGATATSTRDVLAEAAVDNERGALASSALTVSPTNTAVPLPAATTTNPDPGLYASVQSTTRDLAHDPRVGRPDEQPTARAALNASFDSTEAQGLAVEMARRAGLDVNAVNAPGPGSVQRDAEGLAATLRNDGRAQEIPAGTQLTDRQRRRLDGMQMGVPGMNLTPEQKNALRDPATRDATAQQIARNFAEERALTRTFGSAENAAKASEAWASATPQERRDMADAVAQRLDARSDIGTRLGGVVRAGFGAAEVATGVALMAAPTGITQLAGGAVALHGADNVQAGTRQAISGQTTPGITESAIAGGLVAAGVSPQLASTMAALTDAGLSIGGSLAAGSRIAAVQAERATVAGTTSAQQSLARLEGRVVDDVASQGTAAARVGTTLLSGGEASMDILRRAVDVWAQRVTGNPQATGQVFSKQRGELYGFMHEGRYYGMRSSPKETAGYSKPNGEWVAPHVSLEVRVPRQGTTSPNPWNWLTYENGHVNLLSP